jgi:histidinol-phosphate aminotransferase
MNLAPYTAARDIYGGPDRVYLDANESPDEDCETGSGPPLNRYPDPRCGALRSALAGWLNVEEDRLWIGNGSDEALDLLLRVFVSPGEAVAICTPTYGMYDITARANGAAIRNVPLDADFDLDPETVAANAIGSKIIFICSPNNPTGNRFAREKVERLLSEFDGIVVIDEAYIEFSDASSLVALVESHRNLVVLRTLSKAWGLAGARVGYLIADPEIIDCLDRINLPYPLNALSAAAGCEALARPELMQERVAGIVAERERLRQQLAGLGLRVFPSDANFLLVRVADGSNLYRRLAEDCGIVVRDRSGVPRLKDCIRISIGRPQENDRLCAAIGEILA